MSLVQLMMGAKIDMNDQGAIAATTVNSDRSVGRDWEFGPIALLAAGYFTTSALDNGRLQVGTDTPIRIPRTNQATPLSILEELTVIGRGVKYGKKVQLLIDNDTAGSVTPIVVVAYRELMGTELAMAALPLGV